MNIFGPLQGLADWLTFTIFKISDQSMLGKSVNFFLFDVSKILILLVAIVFLVSIIGSFFPPERTKRFLEGKKTIWGNILGALLGIVTPFCSCSAVPLFIGFIGAGVPLGATFSFLVASPMVNEIAIVLLWGLFGWKIALIYIVSGVLIAIVSGWIIGKLKLEGWVRDFVYQTKIGQVSEKKIDWQRRVILARKSVREIIGKVWPYIVIGVALGALIHGYVPDDFLVKYAGKQKIFAVPLVTLLGIPLYSNAAGTIPIVLVLIDKGVAMGTALAFMMSVTALSLPEFIILSKVLKWKLIAVYASVVGLSIIFTGYLFNFVL